MDTDRSFDAVVIGVSAGGFHALSRVLSEIPAGFALPIIVAQHRSSAGSDYLATFLDKKSSLRVKDAEEEELLLPATVYLAPPDLHLLVRNDGRLRLSADPSINGSPPSIDALFSSAAGVFQDRLIGLVMTGANSDGTTGLKAVQDYGGLTVVQDPDTADSKFMPLSALRLITPDRVVDLSRLGTFLSQFGVQHAR